MRVEHIEMIYSTAVVVWTDIITTMCCPIHHVIISPGVHFLPGLLGLAALPHRHGDALAELDLTVLGLLLLLEVALLHPWLLLRSGGVGGLAGGSLHHQLAPLARGKRHITMWRTELAWGREKLKRKKLHKRLFLPSTVLLPIGIVSQIFIS